LVHAGKKLLHEALSDKMKDGILKKLQERPQVKVILEEKVIEDDEMKAQLHLRFFSGSRVVKTDKDTEIQTDLIFYCGGSKINSNSYKDTFSDRITERGEIKVFFLFFFSSFPFFSSFDINIYI